MDHIINSIKTNPETTLDRPNEVTYTSQSYFDTITQRLDSWHVKKQGIKEKRAQLIKTLLIKDIDSLTGTTRTYRITTELLATEQADVHALELPELNIGRESEVMNYAN